MSSNTRFRISLHNISLHNTEALTLNRVLGPGGREALKETLGRRQSLEQQLAPERPGVEVRTPTVLAWQRVESRRRGRELYRLTLRGQQLPPELQRAGAREATVDLLLTRQLAKVTSRATYQSERQEAAAERKALTTAANRAVNDLLALTVARRMQQQLSRRQGVVGQVELRLARRQTLGQQASLGARTHYQARAAVYEAR